ncbi:MAG: hypothetical protein WDZ69_01490 [Candidatus Pacearchaeota archaeon]
MPITEIVDGLKYALARGETLEKAMMSFFNAGYTKEEIEQAAASLNTPQMPQGYPAGTNLQQPSAQGTAQQSPSQTQPSQQLQQSSPQVVQRVSDYGSKPSSSGKAITFVLITILIFLLGILVSVFLFREELAEFLNSLLS